MFTEKGIINMDAFVSIADFTITENIGAMHIRKRFFLRDNWMVWLKEYALKPGNDLSNNKMLFKFDFWKEIVTECWQN